MNMNKKGFTLVELLAVIVILAILAIVAMPNVTGMMENSRKNSFNTEVQQFAKDAETAYTMRLTDTSSKYGILKKISKTGSVVNGYTYYCIALNGSNSLISDNITSKTNNTDYAGVLEMLIDSTGKATTYVSATNGTYSYTVKTLDNIAANGTAKMDTTTWTSSNVISPALAACPTDANAVSRAETIKGVSQD